MNSNEAQRAYRELIEYIESTPLSWVANEVRQAVSEGISIYLTPEIEDEPLLTGPPDRRNRRVRLAETMDDSLALSQPTPETTDVVEPGGDQVLTRPYAPTEQLTLLVDSINRATVEPFEMLDSIFETTGLDVAFQHEQLDVPIVLYRRPALTELNTSTAELRALIESYKSRINE